MNTTGNPATIPDPDARAMVELDRDEALALLGSVNMGASCSPTRPCPPSAPSTTP